MAELKHRTDSEEAQKLEADPDYVTKNIVTEKGIKYGIFEKREEPKKELPKKEK